MESGNLFFSSERPLVTIAASCFFRERRYVSFVAGFLMPLKVMQNMQNIKAKTTQPFSASYTAGNSHDMYIGKKTPFSVGNASSNGGCSLVIREINPIIPKLLPPKKNTSNKNSKNIGTMWDLFLHCALWKWTKTNKILGISSAKSIASKLSNATKGLLKEVVHIGVALTWTRNKKPSLFFRWRISRFLNTHHTHTQI